ncbi:MAG: ATP-binding protein, partial [Candidatus Binataceae bacterium]
PLRMPDSEAVFYAILFEKAALPGAQSLGRTLSRWWVEAFRVSESGSEIEKDRRILQLQREVEATRDYLQTAIEEHETAREELKAAHEEALSANEEFQSTNEELETAKEELQSTNEELTTTNEELHNRIRALDDMNEALRRSRDHLNAIYNTVREPLLVLDSELRVLEANPAFYECFQTQRADTENRLIYELGNRQWDIPLLRSLLEDILPKQAPVRDFAMTYTFPAIGTRTMLLNASRVIGDGNILLAIEDITERTRALGIALALKDTDMQKNQFLAVLSHELRNPLAPIVNALQIMRLQGGENPAQMRARSIIERQIGQMTRLTSDLLEVARVTSGAILLQKESIELSSLIDRAVETTGPLFNQLHHQLSVSKPNEPIWLDADATRLEQVLVNLLTNAAKYTDRGGRIWLTAEREDDKALIHVRDTGIGIEGDLLPHVFDIFSQSQRNLARSQGGLGIGLSIARNLIELHGETIEAHSEGPGKGSEFVIRLPASSPPGVQSESVSKEATQIPQGKLMQVLIVDDSEDTTETAALLLGTWHHEIRVAHTGAEALKVASEYQPDVILLDIGLPGMDGYEVARRLRRDPRFKGTLIIALSGYGGYGQETDHQKSREAGFDEHLIKPVNLEKLNGLLSEKLNAKRDTN